MKFYNDDKKNKILQIYASEDSDVYNLEFVVDEMKQSITISNKGYYSIHLGSFSNLEIKDYNTLNYKIIEEIEFEKFFSVFELTAPLSENHTSVVKNESYLFEDLKEYNGKNLYESFKRILNISHIFLFTKNKEYLETTKYSLEFLVNNWYTGRENYSGNWWFYEIGVPRCLNEILYLLREYIEKQTIDRYLNIERFYLPFAKYIFYRRNYPIIYREVASYANMADNIYICTLRAILQGNLEELNQLFALIDDAIKTTYKDDGFYLDGTFIQHINVPYNASYGEVLINSISKILNIFYLLEFDCSQYIEKIENILIKSYTPFLYDKRAVESVRGRAISRIKQDSRYSFNTIINSVKRLFSNFPTKNISDFLKLENQETYEEMAMSFNYMDRFIYRNTNYLISLNLNSSYISNFESINGENLLGDYSSNFTFDIYYNKEKLNEYPKFFYNNMYYRNGSTNTFNREEPNYIYENELTAGVDLDNMLVVGYKQNTDIVGNFTKIVTPHSLISIGTNINSNFDYVSTIFNFDEECQILENEIISNKKKIIVHNEYILEEVEETFNPYLHNQNEKDEVIKYTHTRAYMKQPKEYHYQIYPHYDNVDDSYEFEDIGNVHIVKYKNYIFINSFDKCEHSYKEIEFSGQFSAILKKVNDEIYVSIASGKREKISIGFKINGYYCDNKNYDNNIVELCDELIKNLIFRRGL